MNREPCFCEGPWADIEPGNRPETVLEREHVLGSIVNARARCDYADPPEPAGDGGCSDESPNYARAQRRNPNAVQR